MRLLHNAAAVLAAWFRDPEGFVLCLRSHVLSDAPNEYVDETFWRRSVAFDYHGVATRVLDNTDELLRVCVQGGRWEHMPPLLWIADTLAVLRGGAALDWDRLINSAQRLHLVVHLREALGYLAATFGAPLPPQILPRLRGLGVSRAEEREYRAHTHARGVLGALPANWFRYRLRLARVRNPLRLLAGFTAYQARLFGLDSAWQLPGALLVRLARKLHVRRRTARDQEATG